MEKEYAVIQCMRSMDTLLGGASFILAYFIKKYLLPEPFRGLIQEPNYYALLLLIIIIWYICFNAVRVYKDLRRHRLFSISADILKANVAALLILSLVLYATNMPISRIMIGIFCVLNVLFMVTFRAVVLMVQRRRDTSEISQKNIVIIGSKDRAADVIETIKGYSGNEIRILGCFDPDLSEVGREVAECCRVLGTMDRLECFLTENVVDELVVAMPLKNIPSGDRYLVMAEAMGITARIVPDWQLHYLAYQPRVASIRVAQFSGVQTLTLASMPRSEGKLFIKALFDYTVSAVLLLLLFPVFLLIGAAIKAVSRGPVFYRQERLGRHGRVFEILKFRTMVADADQRIDEVSGLNECDGPVFKIRKDPRIIPVVGTFLRKTSLDELPQIINVVKGEMSLVGPRPPIPSEVGKYDLWHRRRLGMKPGITCTWQVAPNRNDLPFCKWVELDLNYIDGWSFRTDLLILFKTLKALVTGAGR